MEPDGRPVCCLKRPYSWLGLAGVWRSSSMLLLVGLWKVECALVSRFKFADVGEASWLKSMNSDSGSMHAFDCWYGGAMIIAGCTADAMFDFLCSASVAVCV
jgi:hypothetical protein